MGSLVGIIRWSTLTNKADKQEEFDVSVICVSDDVDVRDFNGLKLTFMKAPRGDKIADVLAKARDMTEQELMYRIMRVVVKEPIPEDKWMDIKSGIAPAAKTKIWALCEEYAGLNTGSFR